MVKVTVLSQQGEALKKTGNQKISWLHTAQIITIILAVWFGELCKYMALNFCAGDMIFGLLAWAISLQTCSDISLGLYILCIIPKTMVYIMYIIVIGDSLSIKLNASIAGTTWIFIPWEAHESEANIYSIEWERYTTECSSQAVKRQEEVLNKDKGYNITELEEGSRYTISVSVSNNEGTTSSVTVTETTLTAGEKYTQ